MLDLFMSGSMTLIVERTHDFRFAGQINARTIEGDQAHASCVYLLGRSSNPAGPVSLVLLPNYGIRKEFAVSLCFSLIYVALSCRIVWA